MGVIGFCIRLIAHAGLIVAGCALIALGTNTAYNTYEMFAAIEQHAETIGESQLQMFAWTPWLMVGGEFLIGLVLVFLGLRGFMGRLAKGVPPPAEAAETAEGRIGHALAFGAGAALGGLLLVSSLVNNADNLVPKLMGESTRAKVLGTRTTQDRVRYYNLLTYQFQTYDGTVRRYESEVPASFLRKHEAGSEIEVRYMPGDPAQHMFPEAVSFTEFTVMLGFYAFLVVAGIGGVHRNLNYVQPD